MTARRYKKVPQIDTNESDDSRKKVTTESLEHISTKVHALFWVVAAICTIYYSDFIKVSVRDSRVNRFRSVRLCLIEYWYPHRVCLNIAVALSVANIGIALYLTLWLPLVQKVTVSWDIYCPRMIPTATFFGISCIVFSVIAFWPVYGFLSPLVIAILVLGALFSTHFIPWPC